MNLANNLVENFREKPDKVCLIQGDSEVDYKELYNKVALFANYLKNKGIGKGSNVLVLVPMSINLYVTLLAIWSIGATACFMDAGFIKNGMKKNKFEEIDSIIGKPVYLLYANINKNLRKLKKKINVHVVDKLSGDNDLQVLEVDKNDPAILTYTSGTTGTPKIAARSHEFLEIQGNILKDCLNYENNDIEISSIPIFTLSNIDVGITTCIADGNFTNLGNSNSERLVTQIINNNINRVMAAPGLLGLITKYCKENSIKIDKVNKVFTGGGAIFVDFINEIKDVFPNAKIVTLYGSTEAEPIAELDVTNLSEDVIEKIKSGNGIPAGSIVGVSDCKTIKTGITEIGDISNEEFENLKIDGIGEIVVAGSNVLKGYVGGIGDKENKFSVGNTKYHRTGDLGYLDENGCLWLRGRIKEPFFNIEAALHASFKMGKTAVFKYNDKIILVLEENNKIKEEDIRKVISFENIDDIKYVKKIPVDKRHSTKVDYKELKRLLKME
jgi:acyl-CoA synthetase (AMP-forming)/AMP-acid ligase II